MSGKVKKTSPQSLTQRWSRVQEILALFPALGRQQIRRQESISVHVLRVTARLPMMALQLVLPEALAGILARSGSRRFKSSSWVKSLVLRH